MPAGAGKVQLVDRGVGIAAQQSLVSGTVTTLTGGRIAVVVGTRLPMNAGLELRHLGAVAGGAELRATRGGLHDVVGAMAGDASFGSLWAAQRRVRLAGQLRRDLRMAGETGSGGGLRRMRELCSPGVAVQAAKSFVHTALDGLRINCDGFALRVG